MSQDSPHLAAMNERQCRELLSAQTVGRIAWQSAVGLQVLPISYVCDGETVVFRTSPYGVLSELAHATEVAVQVDDLDQQRREGQSVLVQGSAEAVEDPADLVHLWTVDGMVPWAPGVRNFLIRVTPRHVSGRMIVRQSADAHAPEPPSSP